jgi:Domain of unknown function (DUF1707)
LLCLSITHPAHNAVKQPGNIKPLAENAPTAASTARIDCRGTRRYAFSRSCLCGGYPVTARPGDETAGAERKARLRASAADREEVIEVLKAAFVQDRITKDELDQRIGKVLTSRTYDDLEILTADIPGALIRTRPATPARPPDPSKKKLIRRTSVAVAGTAFVIAEPAALASHLPFAGVIAGLVAGAFTAGLLTVLLTLIAWAIDRNAGSQPSQWPSPPGALGNAAQQPAPDDPAGQPRQDSRRLRPGAEAARNRLSRSSLAGLPSPQRLPSLTTLALFIIHHAQSYGCGCSRGRCRGGR